MRNKDWINQEGIHANVFLALPKDLLILIAVFSSENNRVIFDDVKKYKMAATFFNKPPTTLDQNRYQEEEKYITNLKNTASLN